MFIVVINKLTEIARQNTNIKMKILSTILISLLFIINQKNDIVVGKWTMCTSGDGKGMQQNYNVCPTIEFKNDGQGIINNKYQFHWTLENKKISFKYDSKDAMSFFGNESKLMFENFNDSKLQYLKIIDSRGYWYLLAK